MFLPSLDVMNSYPQGVEALTSGAPQGAFLLESSSRVRHPAPVDALIVHPQFRQVQIS